MSRRKLIKTLTLKETWPPTQSSRAGREEPEARQGEGP